SVTPSAEPSQYPTSMPSSIPTQQPTKKVLTGGQIAAIVICVLFFFAVVGLGVWLVFYGGWQSACCVAILGAVGCGGDIESGPSGGSGGGYKPQPVSTIDVSLQLTDRLPASPSGA